MSSLEVTTSQQRHSTCLSHIFTDLSTPFKFSIEMLQSAAGFWLFSPSIIQLDVSLSTSSLHKQLTLAQVLECRSWDSTLLSCQVCHSAGIYTIYLQSTMFPMFPSIPRAIEHVKAVFQRADSLEVSNKARVTNLPLLLIRVFAGSLRWKQHRIFPFVRCPYLLFNVPPTQDIMRAAPRFLNHLTRIEVPHQNPNSFTDYS